MPSSRVNWDYIAGFFDGDGNVDCKPNSHGFRRWQLNFYQKRMPILYQIQEFLKSEGIENLNITTSCTCPRLEVRAAADVYKVLLQLRKRCIVKLDEVEDAYNVLEELIDQALNGELKTSAQARYSRLVLLREAV